MSILAVGTTFSSLSLIVEDFVEIDGEQAIKHRIDKDTGAVLVVGTISKILNQNVYLLTPSSKKQKLAIEHGFNYMNDEDRKIEQDNLLVTIYNNKLQRHCYSYINRSYNLDDYNVNYSHFDAVFFCCLQHELLSKIFKESISLNNTTTVLLPNGLVKDYFDAYEDKFVLKYPASFLFINEGELLSLCSRTTEDVVEIIEEKLILNETNLIVTCGSKGVFTYVNKNLEHYSVAPLSKIVHPGGAGDSFATAFIISYLQDNDVSYAVYRGDYFAKRAMQVENIFDLLKEKHYE